jgi:predicted Zn-dependent peptidase
MYFVTVPANKLELWFWMESDRLVNPVFREFYSERDVVREERRLRVESDPTAKFEELFDSMFWTSVPYHHPIVGWPSDVESIDRAQADAFFATYYAPNNLTAVLVGDFDVDAVQRLAKGYFDRIPRAEHSPPPIVTEEIEQLAERRMIAEAETNPEVRIRWHATPFVHRDSAALDVLTSLLSDRTGRLYRALVENQSLATGEPYAYLDSKRYGGAVELGAEVADGHSHLEVETALLAEIERLKKEAVGERELEKIKNQSLADSYRRLRSNMGLLIQLMAYDASGDWRYITDGPKKVQAVTAEDVMRVARTYLTASGKNVLWFVRREGGEEDPELAVLPGQARQMARQALAQIAAIEDPEELGQILAQIRSQLDTAPEEFRPALELLIRRLEERIAALHKEEE